MVKFSWLAGAGFAAVLLATGMERTVSNSVTELFTSHMVTEASAGVLQQPRWAASATGRIEPRGGEVRVFSEAPGRIDDVLVSVGDAVKAGDLLVVISDGALILRRRAAEAEVSLRLRERNNAKASGLSAERRAAEDALAEADRLVRRSQLSYDAAYLEVRAGDKEASALDPLRDALAKTKRARDIRSKALDAIEANPDLPELTRVDAALIHARTVLRQLNADIAKTTIRAPEDGTVLDLWARAGELTGPRSRLPLLLFGNLASLQARAEVEERDAPKILVGQHVVVRADAYPDQEFVGRVTTIARSLGRPRIATRGPRRPNDLEVLEVVVILDGTPPLIPGMRVDVFFHATSTASTGGAVR